MTTSTNSAKLHGGLPGMAFAINGKFAMSEGAP
jgi:hypothetical protein